MDTSFGAYQLDEPLGTLPFGELVAATHPARSESLALLLLDARLSSDHRFRGLVRLEMARVGGLRQAGIARMVEISEQSGALALVYERPADGTSLAAQLASGPALGRDAAHSLIRRLAESLDAAHGRRIAHGLVGPASILIGSDGAATLVGVGLLAAVEEAGLRAHMLERADAASLAPEQKSGKLAVASADGYALAVLAEQILGAESAQARAALDRQQSAVPAQRFPTCVAFAAALSELSASAGAPTPDAPAADSPRVGPIVVSAAPSSPAPPPSSYSAPDYAAPPPSYATPPPRYAAPPSPAPPPAPAPAASTPAPAAPTPTWTPEPPPWTPPATEPSEQLVVEPAPSSSPAPLSPAPLSPPPTAPLPWNAPQSAAAESPAITPAYAQPPARMAAPEPSAPSDSGLPAWLRDTLDPPNARGQHGPQTASSPAGPARMPVPSVPQAAPDAAPSNWRRPKAQPPTVTRSQPTPAMLAFQKSLSTTDLGTTLVLAVTSRVAVLDQLTDRYAPDGKIGPVPLGVIVAGALAAILLLLRQPAAAAIFGVLVLGLYAMPKLLAKVVAADQPPPEAVRVTGTVSVRKREIGINWDVFEVDIEDGAPLTLPASGYRRLASLGTPITVERPTMYGPEQVTVAHELHGVTLTYLLPGRQLLDVRDASGTVIHRHPDYAGEPGDRASLDAPSGGLGATGGRGATAFERPAQTPTWRTTPYGHRITLRMPPTLAGELDSAFKSAATKAGLINGIPLLVLIVSAFTGNFGFFALIAAGAIFVLIGSGQLMRALTLYKAREAESIVQVAARMSLRQVERSGSKGSKSQHYFMRLDDGAELKIPRELFEKLARLGRQLEMGERPGIWERLTQSEETVRAYELQGPTVTYEPSAELLLEIMDAGGNTLFRDSAVTPRSIGDVPPR